MVVDMEVKAMENVVYSIEMDRITVVALSYSF
jgi:hypothetical protein